MKVKTLLPNLRSVDYRHYICCAITIGFIACGFIFTNALPCLAESIRDLGLSIAYYVCELFCDVNPIRATVTEMPAWEFAPSRFEPLKLLPYTWEEFKTLWGEYWSMWATWDNFEDYLAFWSDVLFYLSKALLIVMPLVLCFWLWLGSYTNTENTRRLVETKPLRRWRRFTFKV